MGLSELTDAAAVLAAMREFDALGRDRFLEKHGFARSRYFLVEHDGRRYDSKALAAVAYERQFPQRQALLAAEFSGGAGTVVPVFRRMGFRVVDTRGPRTKEPDSGIAMWLGSNPRPRSYQKVLPRILESVADRPGTTILTPECFAYGSELDRPDPTNTLALRRIIERYRDAKVRLILGIRHQPTDDEASRQILIDSNDPDRAYRKHTHDKKVAFDDPRWTERGALPTLSGQLGPLICQDLYLSLLASSLVRRGARTLLYPSGGNVIRRKWLRLLRARAIENQVPVYCTLSRLPGNNGKQPSGTARAWMIRSDGRIASTVDASGVAVEEAGQRPGHLYWASPAQVDPGDPPVEPVPDATAFSDGDRVTCGDASVRVGGEIIATSPSGSTDRDQKLVTLDNLEWLDPSNWVRPYLEAPPGQRIAYLIRTAPEHLAKARVISEARAIELSSPTVIDRGSGSPIVVEQSTRYKDVRATLGRMAPFGGSKSHWHPAPWGTLATTGSVVGARGADILKRYRALLR